MIDTIDDCIDLEEPINPVLAKELLDSYKKLIESNAELHKELAKLRGENSEHTQVVKGLDVRFCENCARFIRKK